MKFKTVFGPGTGGPSEFYRIPSMITTKSGVTVACADARFCSGKDNPNRIDKVVRRSLDSGETWGEYITVVEEHGTEQKLSSAAIDPILTYDSETNRIFLHYCHTPAGVGILNSKSSKGVDESGNRIITDGLKKYILKDGFLYTQNRQKTDYRVSKKGNVTKSDTDYGNIYTGGKFRELSTSFLMMCYSDDDGVTWSKPQCLNSAVKEKYMSFIGPGPGNGIVIKKGKYAGRIIVPIYYGVRKFPLGLSCCVIYSDDKGETWKRGETPNNTRKIHGITANQFLIIESQMLTESQVIEQENGRLKYYMRNHNKKRCVATAYSDNGGESWENFSLDKNLNQPICQTSVIKLNGMEKPYVVLLNAADKKERKCGTVRLSEDDGETFHYSRILKADSFVYSSLAQLPDGNIGALFEPDTECKNILFTKFSLEWIRGGEG